MYMRLKDGKSKVVTLSYDDGVVQDIRLMEIMNKYGLKGTFNINSGRYFPEDGEREKFYGRMKKSEALKLYTNSGHEVAIHGVNHTFLDKMETDEIVLEIIEDRKNLEADYKIPVRGMAYPFGTYNDRVIDALKLCRVAYARTTKSTEGFNFPENWLTLHPTCHHNNPNLLKLAEKFLTGNVYNNPTMFYLWGHSYEFDNNDNWDVIEEFAKAIGGKEDVWYATNIEIYDYIQAYNSLITSADKKIIYNPAAVDVWVYTDGKNLCVKSGETVNL